MKSKQITIKVGDKFTSFRAELCIITIQENWIIYKAFHPRFPNGVVHRATPNGFYEAIRMGVFIPVTPEFETIVVDCGDED